jgi:hypothetical protein
MRQETENSISYPEQHNTFDIKKFFFRIIRKWYWFALSIFLGLLIAWLYNHYMPTEYSIHSSLIVNEYESGIKRLSLTQGYQRPWTGPRRQVEISFTASKCSPKSWMEYYLVSENTPLWQRLIWQ